MIERRRFLISAGCFAAAAAAYRLKPSQYMSLIKPGQKLDRMIPMQFGDWTARDVGDLFAPVTEDAVMTKLYESVIGRIYHQSSSGAEVLVMVVHGSAQTNSLQLHRPEVCYPAFGYQVQSSDELKLEVGRQVTIPSRLMTAKSTDEEQTVLYWTRMGEFLPTSGGEQRLVRFEAAMKGYIADGLLARFSVGGNDVALSTRILGDFVKQMLQSVAPKDLPALIGSERAAQLGALRNPSAAHPG